MWIWHYCAYNVRKQIEGCYNALRRKKKIVPTHCKEGFQEKH